LRTIRGRAAFLGVVFTLTVTAANCALANTQDPGQAAQQGSQQSQQSGTTGTAASQSDSKDKSQAKPPDTTTPPAPAPAPAPTPAGQKSGDPEPKQTNRMFWIVPNFAAVSANTQLPRLSTREKFVIASKDSVDYTSFLWAGVLAGQGFALKSSPALGHGAAGYGRYYWRAFADQASGAYFTEAIVPALTREDPRYYTLGHGSVFRRTLYALSQLYLTKMDSGKIGFNFSEILGNGMEAGLSNLYYPPQERGFGKTAENWGAGIESAALNNVVKEFWPDIRQMILSLTTKKKN